MLGRKCIHRLSYNLKSLNIIFSLSPLRYVGYTVQFPRLFYRISLNELLHILTKASLCQKSSYCPPSPSGWWPVCACIWPSTPRCSIQEMQRWCVRRGCRPFINSAVFASSQRLLGRNHPPQESCGFDTKDTQGVLKHLDLSSQRPHIKPHKLHGMRLLHVPETHRQHVWRSWKKPFPSCGGTILWYLEGEH